MVTWLQLQKLVTSWHCACVIGVAQVPEVLTSKWTDDDASHVHTWVPERHDSGDGEGVGAGSVGRGVGAGVGHAS